MASSIDASTSGAGGVITTADNTGILQLKTAGVVAVTVNASSALGVGTSPSYGTSGQVLTSSGSSAAPTWSTISSGGMTLLGTLTTTSGTTQTLSGLTLTGYKALFFSFNAVSCTGSGQITINGSYNVSAYLGGAAETAIGTGWLDLSNGVVAGSIASQSYPYVAGSVTNVTTASTSISFNSPATTTFDAGSIKVYGVA